MSKWRARRLAALLIIVPVLALCARAEGGESPAPADAVYAERVEEQAEPASDAGDTGLSVEDSMADPGEDGPAEEYGGDAALPEADGADRSGEELSGADFSEGVDGEEAAPKSEGIAQIYYTFEAAPEMRPQTQAWIGYAAVAAQTQVYADAALTSPLERFPEGAVVYVEAVEASGSALRVRYDTEADREWAGDLPGGYIAAELALAYTDEETSDLLERLDADPRTRTSDGVPIPCVAVVEAEAAKAGTAGLGVDARSQSDIQAFVDAHPAWPNQVNLFSVAGTDDPYTTGRLSPVNQQSALNMINQVRYIAGLDADVTLYAEKEPMMAAAALVNRLNSALSHYPERPVALADSAYDALYELGRAGCGSANISMGYTATGSILAYMADSDDYNRAEVGHRRWVLNPTLSRTVLGASERFSAMYAHDMSGSGGQTKVAWPAQVMPVQYFSAGDPWSISYGRTLEASGVTVDLVRASDGRTWRFASDAADGFFTVENNYFGRPGCVIFRPEGLEAIGAGEAFNVAVTDGSAGEVTRYTVRFFDLDLTSASPLAAPEVTALALEGRNWLIWSAVPRAGGYYVCRKVDGGDYQIIADVTDAEYYDREIFPDLNYTYRVYAHTASVTSRTPSGVRPVIPRAEAVSLDQTGTLTIYTTDTLKLNAALEPAYARTSLTWKSTRKRVARVDESGLVTPVRRGTTIISVQTDNGKKASVKLKVVEPPKPRRVALNYGGTVTLTVGDTLALTAAVLPADVATTLTWSSGRPGVAQVSQDGLVTALSEGTAQIRVRTDNGKKDKLKIRVVDPFSPDKVKLSPRGTVKLTVGETLALNATLTPASAVTELRWTSSRPGVAAVADGLVTALAEGSAYVKVATANGKTAKMKVKVTDPNKPSKVTLSLKGTVTLRVGETLTLEAALAPATARTTLTWTSAKPAVAAVADGRVVALKKGSATITVRTANGKRARVRVKVVE